MNKSEHTFHDATVIVLQGDLDQSALEVFDNMIERLQALKARHVILDCSGVTKMDRAGLSQLFVTAHLLRQKGIRRSLVCPSFPVRDRLERFGLTSLFPIYISEFEARAVI